MGFAINEDAIDEVALGKGVSTSASTTTIVS
jgi:hypothetical protein